MTVSVFRGAAGEVVRCFVRPGTILTLIPVMVVSIVLTIVIGGAVSGLGLPAPLTPLLLVVAVAPIAGRFALAARDGELGAGFFAIRLERGALLAFVSRYAVLTGLWGVPAFLLIAWLGWAALQSWTAGSLLTGGPAGLALVLAVVAVVLAPTLSLIVATRTDSIGDVLSLAPWRWLLLGRRGDLVAFYAALLGGSLLFTVMAWPLLLVLGVLASFVSPEATIAIATFAWAVPAAAAPVLLGRLAGAFVAGESSLRDPDDRLRETVLTGGGLPPATVAALAGASPSVRTPAGEAVTRSEEMRRLRSRAVHDLDGAIAETERLVRRQASNPMLAAELACLYRRAGRKQDAWRAAALAIERALASGANGVAAEVFQEFAGEGETIVLDPAALELLGWAFLERRDLAAAGRCFEVLAGLRGYKATAEKGLVKVADETAAAGEVARALELYRAFLEGHPASRLGGYVRNAIVRLGRAARGAA